VFARQIRRRRTSCRNLRNKDFRDTVGGCQGEIRRPGPEYDYDDIIGESLLFSPDSNHLAYTALKDNKWFIMLDEQAGPKYDRLYKPAFTADGIEYLAENDGWILRCRQTCTQSGAGDKTPDAGKLVKRKIGRSPKLAPDANCKTCPPPESHRRY